MKRIATKRLCFMVGFPGSGKSTFARRLVTQYHFVYLSSDMIRKELFKSLRFDAKGNEKILQEQQETYRVLYERAEDLIKKGESVVVDATHLDTKRREALVQQFSSLLPLEQMCWIVLKTPRDVIEKRMAISNECVSQKETPLEAWRRVMAYFDLTIKEGVFSFPEKKTSGIDIVETYDPST